MGRKHHNASGRLKVVNGGGGGRRRGLPPRAGNQRKKRPRQDNFEAAKTKSGRRPRIEPDWDSADLEPEVEETPVEETFPTSAATPIKLDDSAPPEDSA